MLLYIYICIKIIYISIHILGPWAPRALAFKHSRSPPPRPAGPSHFRIDFQSVFFIICVAFLLSISLHFSQVFAYQIHLILSSFFLIVFLFCNPSNLLIRAPVWTPCIFPYNHYFVKLPTDMLFGIVFPRTLGAIPQFSYPI